MRFILITAAKDLRRRLADPAALLIWIGFPIILGTFMRLLSGDGSGQSIKAHLLLVDQDKSPASQLIAGGGRQNGAARYLEIEEVSQEEGARRIDAGDGTALLTIPEGFQHGLLNQQATELTLITNPAQRILPLIVEEGLRLTVEAAFSRGFNPQLTSVGGDPLPPVIRLDVKTDASSALSVDFGAIFFPGLLFMSLLFMASGTSSDIWIEKERGTLRRALTTPQHAGLFVAGKLAAGTALMGLVVLAGLALGVAVFKVSVARVPFALIWACYAGAALACFFLLIQLLATNARGGNLLSLMVVFPLMMIGGSFFPFDLMPGWMANIGRWTPNGLAVTHLKEILFGRPTIQSMAVAAALIGIPAAAAFLLSVGRVRGRFAT